MLTVAIAVGLYLALLGLDVSRRRAEEELLDSTATDEILAAFDTRVTWNLITTIACHAALIAVLLLTAPQAPYTLAAALIPAVALARTSQELRRIWRIATGSSRDLVRA